MSLQEDAKKLLPFIQAAAEGKLITACGNPVLRMAFYCSTKTDDGLFQADHMKIVASPVFRAWVSVEEMGETVNDWFRRKDNHRRTRKITNFSRNEPDCIVFGEDGDVHTYLNNLFNGHEHSPTPWLNDSWLPCGVEVKP